MDYSDSVIERARKIRMLLVDVDGVMTDGRIVLSNFGDESKNFDVNDGLGIVLVKRAGLFCVILTAMASRIVARRARELKVDKVYHNFHYKIEAYGKIKKRFNVKDEEVCFMGDDLIDIPVLRRVGLAAAPPNAMKEVKDFAHFVTEKKGGRGAVREVCELLLKSQGLWEKVAQRYFE